jgi:hypothetical protein
MFSMYNQLNEGGCINNEKKCTGRKLFEGRNPKYLSKTNSTAQVNSHWEKLRK